MELKEFIINTVNDILDAVNELQEENKTNAIINPVGVNGDCPLVSPPNKNNHKSRLVEVEFNVRLCEAEASSIGRGIGVSFNGLGVKLGNDRKDSCHSDTSIKFLIPLLLPIKG